jgi:GAF domain-containing protein
MSDGRSILDVMRKRSRALSAFRQRAAHVSRADTVLADGVTVVGTELGVALAGVFEFEESTASLYLRAGIGWRESVLGPLVLSTAPSTLGGHALSATGVVIVECLSDHPQFCEPLLTQHGATSALVVSILVQRGPWGVLGLFSRSRRMWMPDDLELARGVSGAIAAALYREEWARRPNPPHSGPTSQPR